ncbi:MAG: Nif11-like leader peptide family natural product precursor [Cyanobacteria bacterium]|nr:Nif11-like leader peptide family natural product precursor [Cyanobacteriota bacterium]
MSKAQLTAFFLKVDGDASLKARVDSAAGPDAVVAIAIGEGHNFSAATLTRHLRG